MLLLTISALFDPFKHKNYARTQDTRPIATDARTEVQEIPGELRTKWRAKVSLALSLSQLVPISANRREL